MWANNLMWCNHVFHKFHWPVNILSGWIQMGIGSGPDPPSACCRAWRSCSRDLLRVYPNTVECEGLACDTERSPQKVIMSGQSSQELFTSDWEEEAAEQCSRSNQYQEDQETGGIIHIQMPELGPMIQCTYCEKMIPYLVCARVSAIDCYRELKNRIDINIM